MRIISNLLFSLFKSWLAPSLSLVCLCFLNLSYIPLIISLNGVIVLEKTIFFFVHLSYLRHSSLDVIVKFLLIAFKLVYSHLTIENLVLQASDFSLSLPVIDLELPVLGRDLLFFSLAFSQLFRKFIRLRLIFLEISLKFTIFLSQELLLFIDLSQNNLTKISTKFLRAARLIDFHKLFDLVGELCPQSLILRGDLNVLFFEVDELLVDGLEATLELLYFCLVSIEEGDESELILMEDGVGADGIIELVILISRTDVELSV